MSKAKQLSNLRRSYRKYQRDAALWFLCMSNFNRHLWNMAADKMLSSPSGRRVRLSFTDFPASSQLFDKRSKHISSLTVLHLFASFLCLFVSPFLLQSQFDSPSPLLTSPLCYSPGRYKHVFQIVPPAKIKALISTYPLHSLEKKSCQRPAISVTFLSWCIWLCGGINKGVASLQLLDIQIRTMSLDRAVRWVIEIEQRIADGRNLQWFLLLAM